jgi:putative PIN family toxin of toxin-antitoxin system
MKIVMDTNVLISGIFFTGPPYQILKAWQKGKITFVVSEEILSEYQRVANEMSLKFPTIDIRKILQLITIHSEIVNTHGYEVTICEDPDDNMFISCAVASKSKVIVSGDKHLLKIVSYQNIRVLKPKEFVDNYLI